MTDTMVLRELEEIRKLLEQIVNHISQPNSLKKGI